MSDEDEAMRRGLEIGNEFASRADNRRYAPVGEAEAQARAEQDRKEMEARQEEWRNRPVLTVGKLKELLNDIPDDAIIQSEGCDCTGDADGIDYTGEDNSVTITRKYGE